MTKYIRTEDKTETKKNESTFLSTGFMSDFKTNIKKKINIIDCVTSPAKAAPYML